MNAQPSTAVKPFKLQIPDRDIADLHERLRRTRWPDEPPLAPWSTGTSLAYMRGLVDYWEQFGWPDLCQPLENGDFACE